jgi:hypothetical protein
VLYSSSAAPTAPAMLPIKNRSITIYDNFTTTLPQSLKPTTTNLEAEWQRRIDRKLILNDRQMAIKLSSPIEVGSFDFQGKVRLINLAIENNLAIEIEFFSKDSTTTLLTKPLSLKTKEGERYLEAMNLTTFNLLTFTLKHLISLKLIKANLLD